MRWVVFLSMMVTITGCGMSRVAENRTCNRGQYLRRQVIAGSGEQEICVACPVGTFGPYDNHRNRNCAYCSTTVGHRHEVVLQECTSTTDTVIGCHAGFFRQNFRTSFRLYGDCNRCSRCEELNMFEMEPCQAFRDTICSTQARPFNCSRGQYVSKNDANQSVCLPCVNGTFQPLDVHQDVACARCSIAEAVMHEITLQACTTTADTIIGCEPGYYREFLHLPIHYKPMEDCTRCSLCLQPGTYIKRQCAGYNNTLCCPLSEAAGAVADPECARS